MKIKTYKTAEEALRATSEALVAAIKKSESRPYRLALSGGSTAQALFKSWAEKYKDIIPWSNLRFYWVDERCVSPEDEESNYKHACRLLFSPLGIPDNHIRRIRGEQVPEVEAERYSEMVKGELPGDSGTPRFDCVILGIGTDGHVASIFPNNMELLADRRVYAVAQHPITKQQRVTLTGTVILKSPAILIPVIGKEKQGIMGEIAREAKECPASYILAHSPSAIVFTDRA